MGVNTVILHLLREVGDIFKISRVLSDIKRNLREDSDIIPYILFCLKGVGNPIHTHTHNI